MWRSFPVQTALSSPAIRSAAWRIDVYKRQLLGRRSHLCPVPDSARPHENAAGKNYCNACAVSYTHLDVYKRQAYDRFFREGLYSDYPQQTQMYVYPRQVDTARIQMICRADVYKRQVMQVTLDAVLPTVWYLFPS